MQAIKHSMKFMVTHSIVSFILVLIIMVFFSVFQILISTDNTPTNKAMMGALMINLTMSVFLGTYFGGALQSLKQNYLWIINQHYRNTLMAAFLFIIGLLSLLQIPFLYLNLNTTLLLLFVPFCIAIFSSHMVLGKNLLHKIIIPAVPLGLYQLHRINISLAIIIILLFICTLVLIIAMYLNRFYPDNSVRQTAKQGMEKPTIAQSKKVLTSFNYSIGIFIAKWVSQSKRNIDWAILMPHTKLALFSFLYIIIISLFTLISEDKPIIEMLSIMFLSISIIYLIMGSRGLIKQTRVIAHVFSGTKHRQLKNRMLFSIDKVNLINTMVFVCGILIITEIFSIPLNTTYILIASLAITLITLAYYPLLLCLSWVNISLQLLVAIVSYSTLIFFCVRWIKEHTSDILIFPHSIVFIIACLLLRGITQYIFWQRPFENLMKNK